MKKWLVGTLFTAGSDLRPGPRSNCKQKGWKRTVKPGHCLFKLLILMSGDVQIQSGPPKVTDKPAYQCEFNVRSNQAALQCDSCDTRSHRKCLNMSLTEYRRLGNCDDQWFCNRCILSQFTGSFLSLQDNSSQAAGHVDLPRSDDAVRLNDMQQSGYLRSKGANLIHLNARSRLLKLDKIQSLAINSRVAVIGITETWLDSTVLDSEVETPGYLIVRKD